MRRLSVLILVMALSGGAAAQNNAGLVSVGGVTNAITETALEAGYTHLVTIQYDFTSSPAGLWNTYNAFEVYSPDGANWVNLVAADGPLTTALSGGIARYRKYYTSTDNGGVYTATATGGSTLPGGSAGPSSRVAYSLAVYSPTGAGYASGTSGVALTLQFQSLMADTGKTICVDTVNAAGTLAWQWTSGEALDHPVWDNGLGQSAPRCWEIGTCVNGVPEWCMCVGEECGDNVYYGYCGAPSYTLCAVPYCAYGSVEYRLLPPYDNGDYGSVNAQTGLWTWPNPELSPGSSVDIRFQAVQLGGVTFEPFTLHVTATGCDCCVGRVGDANMSGEDEPTVGDVSVLIDHLFVSGAPLTCLPEADVNQSGGVGPFDADITIGDVSALIDYLFITGPDAGTLPNCL